MVSVNIKSDTINVLFVAISLATLCVVSSRITDIGI